MRDYTYSFVMMDSYNFRKYEQRCKREGIKVNYTILGANNYGVMIAREQQTEEVRSVKNG